MTEDRSEPSVWAKEKRAMDGLADLYTHYLSQAEKYPTAGLARAAYQEQVQRILYFSTGHKFEVRQVIPPPTNPRPDRGGRSWR